MTNPINLTVFVVALSLCLAGCGLYALAGKPKNKVVGSILIGSAAVCVGVIFVATTRISGWLFNRHLIDVDLYDVFDFYPVLLAALVVVILTGIFWNLGFRKGWAALSALALVVAYFLWQPPQGTASHNQAVLAALVAALVGLVGANVSLARPRFAWALPLIAAVALVWLIYVSNNQLPIPQPVLAASLRGGFRINLFSQLADSPTAMALDSEGALYVTTAEGNVLKLWDTTGQGVADQQTTFASNLGQPLGIVWHNGQLYISTNTAGQENSGRVVMAQDTTGDGIADQSQDILTGLPSGLHTWHQNNGLAIGPDERLYLGIGSSSDHNPETVPYAATIVSMKLDGSDLQVFATGLRNPYGLAFSPTGQLFATDNSPDHLDYTQLYVPPDKLNLVVKGGDYGFPNYTGKMLPPVAQFMEHTVPTGLTVYSGTQFPSDYRDNIFVAFWQPGPELDRGLPSRGQRIARLVLSQTPDGLRATDYDFVTGLQAPVDVKVGPEGQIYIADMFAQRIYRVTYTP